MGDYRQTCSPRGGTHGPDAVGSLGLTGERRGQVPSIVSIRAGAAVLGLRLVFVAAVGVVLQSQRPVQAALDDGGAPGAEHHRVRGIDGPVGCVGSNMADPVALATSIASPPTAR